MPGATSWCHNSAPSVHFVHAHNHNEHYSASLFQRLKLHKYKTVFDIRWDMHNLKSCQNIVKKRYFTLLLHMQRQKDILGVYLSVDWSQRGRNEWENSCSMKKKILIITKSIAEIKECLFCVLKYPRKYCSISKVKEEKMYLLVHHYTLENITAFIEWQKLWSSPKMLRLTSCASNIIETWDGFVGVFKNFDKFKVNCILNNKLEPCHKFLFSMLLASRT